MAENKCFCLPHVINHLSSLFSCFSFLLSLTLPLGFIYCSSFIFSFFKIALQFTFSSTHLPLSSVLLIIMDNSSLSFSLDVISLSQHHTSLPDATSLSHFTNFISPAFLHLLTLHFSPLHNFFCDIYLYPALHYLYFSLLSLLILYIFLHCFLCSSLT